MRFTSYIAEVYLPKILYHGTVGELNLKPGVLYLTPKKSAAALFGSDPILVRGRKGTSRVYRIKAASGQVKDINSMVENALKNDEDLNKIIFQEAAKARKSGYQYLKFSHGGEFDVIVSVYPDQDLEIL